MALLTRCFFQNFNFAACCVSFLWCHSTYSHSKYSHSRVSIALLTCCVSFPCCLHHPHPHPSSNPHPNPNPNPNANPNANPNPNPNQVEATLLGLSEREDVLLLAALTLTLPTDC